MLRKSGLSRELQNSSPHKIALLAPVALAAAAFGPGSLLRSPALHCEGSPDLLVSSQPLIQVCFRRRQPNPPRGFWQQVPKSSIFCWRGVLQFPLSLWISLFFVFSCAFVQAKHAPAASKKYELSICSLFKNEAKFLKEWIEFHRLVGVDHFYLYNNGSVDNYLEILEPYLKKGIVTLIQWPDRTKSVAEDDAYMWALSTQVIAYENAIKLQAVDTKWLIFADIDDFILPARGSTLKEILNRYDDFSGILLSSDFYDASEVNVLPKRKLLIETVEMTNALPQNVQRCFEKMIVKPQSCKGFHWPPYKCVFNDNLQPVKMDRHEIRINHYIHRKRNPWQFAKIKEKIQVDHQIISDEERFQLLDAGFEIEDQERLIYRFVPELLKKMGFR